MHACGQVCGSGLVGCCLSDALARLIEHTNAHNTHANAQVLLVNMVTSVTLGMALAAEPAEPDVMDRKPRSANKRLVNKLLLWRMLFVSHVIIALLLGTFYWGGACLAVLVVRGGEGGAEPVLPPAVHATCALHALQRAVHARCMRSLHAHSAPRTPNAPAPTP